MLSLGHTQLSRLSRGSGPPVQKAEEPVTRLQGEGWSSFKDLVCSLR